MHGNSGVANKAAFLITDGATFNGQTVVGLGIDKAAAIWYRVETSYLGTASDYADLGDYLAAACHDLLGSTPNDIHGQPSASGAFRAKDCTQVSHTVLATEMETQPPAAPAPRTAACTTGSAVTTGLLDDGIDASASDWNGLGQGWAVNSSYARSAPYALHGKDTGKRALSTLTLKHGVTIPATGATFLTFDHAYGFDDGSNDTMPNNNRYDGGVLEYSANGGAWKDAGALFTFNGYNGKLHGTTQAEPLAGRRAFTAESNGYVVTKATLTSLKGEAVKLRFRIGSDTQQRRRGRGIDVHPHRPAPVDRGPQHRRSSSISGSDAHDDVHRYRWRCRLPRSARSSRPQPSPIDADDGAQHVAGVHLHVAAIRIADHRPGWRSERPVDRRRDRRS